MQTTRKGLLVAALALLAAGLPLTAARAQPKIELVNPSAYVTGQVPQLSDKENRPVHLVAWVQDIPPAPQVEFEIQPPTSPIPGAPITENGIRVGATETWEAFWAIPSNATEGQYTVIARLFSNQEEIATSSQLVTVDRATVPPQAENVELTQPENGAALGFYTPAGKRSATILRAQTSMGVEQVQAFYTQTDPGEDPQWTACGNAEVIEQRAVIRCTLAEGVGPASVTAVSAVANSTPFPGDPQRAGDDGADSHRVLPYLQRPTEVDVSPATTSQDVSKCLVLTATVIDQEGLPIPAVNVDVHAEGPTDQLRFVTDDTPVVRNNTSPYRAPDKGHVSSEPTIRCSDGMNAEQQGDHNVPAVSDRKHIESTTGTNNEGGFAFGLISGVTGGTFVTVWSDDNDDDVLQTAETTGGAQIGWGQEPPEAPRQVTLEPASATATTGTCQRVTLIAKQGGNALPGVNVDVHASGPDASVAFCLPPEGGSVARDPDQGAHVGGADDEDTRHLEGETDSFGRLAFGITSTSEGTTVVEGWLDNPDDDVRSPGDPAQTAQISWAVSGERSIGIQSNRSSARKGRSVRIFGTIEAESESCESGQAVRLQSKPRRGGRFRTISTTATDEAGNYTFTRTVRKTKRYRAVAPLAGACEKATSPTITVRATS